jgi:hypothetical protein
MLARAVAAGWWAHPSDGKRTAAFHRRERSRQRERSVSACSRSCLTVAFASTMRIVGSALWPPLSLDLDLRSSGQLSVKKGLITYVTPRVARVDSDTWECEQWLRPRFN